MLLSIIKVVKMQKKLFFPLNSYFIQFYTIPAEGPIKKGKTHWKGAFHGSLLSEYVYMYIII